MRAVVAAQLDINWPRLGRRAFIGALVALASLTVWHRAGLGQIGLDFHGGAWKAARAILHGHSPYPPADPRLLYSLGNAYVTPPPLALLATPFAVLSLQAALLLWSLMCVGSFAAALWLVGLRDGRLYAVALCSFPFVDSIVFGQADGVLALLLALGWRYRDSYGGPIAVGVLIAAKLFVWPLLIWLVVARRVRAAVVASLSAVAVLVASWAAIGFSGAASFPKLLSADAHAFELSTYSNSVLGVAMRLGLPQAPSIAIAISLAALVVALTARCARDPDEGWFAGAVLLGLLLSPVLWPHYLVLLLVPLAISRPHMSTPWGLVCLLWVAAFSATMPIEPRVLLILGSSVAAIVLAVSWPSRRAELARCR